MRFRRLAVAVSALLPLAAILRAQSSEPVKAHTIVVKLVDHGGPMPYAFEPAVVTVERGDTVRFTEWANVMHNVRFTKQPHGARLGAAEVSPYLMKLGDVYVLIIDKRFPDGTYSYVCEPHQMIGMKGTMVVAGR